MSYTPEFTPKYEDGWENLPIETTPIVAQALNDYDDALEHIENYLANSQSIRDIKDIDLTGLANGNTIIYNSGSNKFVPGNAGSGGSSRLAELNDVSLTDPTNGEALVYNNGTWVNDATQSVARIYSATCASQADVQNKVVTVSNDQQFKLVKGAVIFVKFAETNQFYATASAHITLNVNSTGAIPIYAGNTNALIGINITYYGRANFINQYVYDGTYWVWTGSSADNNSIYVNREPLSGGIEQSLVTTGEKWDWYNMRLDGLKDTDIDSPTDGQIVKYDETSEKWINVDDLVVEANPTGEPTDNLETIQIGDTLYNIPGGGGNANIWTGTQAEYAQQASQIADGTLVNITDDEGGYIDEFHVYSTDEHVVGRWIDGSLIYEQTFYLSQLPNNTTVKIAKSGVAFMVKLFGTAYASSGVVAFRPIPFAADSTNTIRADFDGQDNTDGIRIQTYTNWSAYRAYITLQFTKTA